MGRGRKAPPRTARGLPETQKAVSSVNTQHRLNHSERNTIGPIHRLSPLQKGLCLGIIRLRCSRKTVVLSGQDTHHRGIAGSQPAMPCRFIAFPATFYTMPRQKSSDSSTCGTVFQPLLGCQLRFYSCAGGASVPLWSMGTACRQTEEYKGKCPRWRVLWPLPGD